MSAKTDFKDGNILNANELNGLGEAINQNELNLIALKSWLSTCSNNIDDMQIITSAIDFHNGYVTINGDKYYPNPSIEYATDEDIAELFD